VTSGPTGPPGQPATSPRDATPTEEHETISLRRVSPALGTPRETPWTRDFSNASYEWRRLAAEVAGTFLLVLAAAGAGSVAAFSGGEVGRNAAVVAPALTVMAVILAIGAVSGAHLNPVVSVAFALREEFPWLRVPLYVLSQAAGAVLACLFLRAMFGTTGNLGATLPGPRVTDPRAMWMEAVLTFGLVTVILGTASGAQNVGALSALAVAGYIALAGLWASPITGASMNPARSFGPVAVTGHFSHFWVYVAGPTIGMAAAVCLAYVLRGRGRDPTATRAAQGTLGTFVVERVPELGGTNAPTGGGANSGASVERTEEGDGQT